MYLTFDGVHTVPFSLCSFSILSSSGISQPSNVAWLLLGVGRLPLLFSACALPVRGEWRAERGGAVQVPKKKGRCQGCSQLCACLVGRHLTGNSK